MPSGALVKGTLDSLIDSDGQRRRNGDVTEGNVPISKVISPCDEDGPSRVARVASQCSSARFLRTPSRGLNDAQDGVIKEDRILITQWSDRDQFDDEDVISGNQSSEDEYDLSSQSNSCHFETGDIDQEDAYDTDLEVDDDKWLLANQGEFDPTGLRDYIVECNKLGVISASYFARHVHDKAFVMKHYQLGPMGAKAIAKPFEVNTTIEKIDLEGNRIGNRGCVYIARVLKDNLYVTDLNLSENNIGSSGAAALCEMMLENSTISTLDLSGNGFRDCDGTYFSQILQRNTSLVKLSLKHNNFDDDTAMQFRDALAGNEFLRMLDLSWNHFRMKGAEYLADIIRDNYGLKYLNLAMNGLSDDGAKLIGEALKVNQCLVDLNISSNRISIEGALDIARGIQVNETLQTLRIGQNPICADGALSMLESIHKNADTAITLLDVMNVVVSEAFEKLHIHINEDRPNMPFLQVVHGGVLFRGKHLIYIDEDEPGRDFESDPMAKLRKYAEKTKYRLIDVFKQFDTDNSWTLSRDEILKGGLSKGMGITEKEVDRFIERLDKDGDGEIDFAELLAGDSDFRKKQRDEKKELATYNSDDDDDVVERGKTVALSLGERDDFTTDT